MKKVLATILMALAVTAVFVSCDDPKHEHSYNVNNWKSDSNSHWHVCTTCGEKLDIAAHTWDNGKETTPATEKGGGVITYTCKVCKRTKTKRIDHEHVLVTHEAQARTCTQSGWDAYVTCTKCDYTTKKEIPALGHDLSLWSDINDDATKRTRNCKRDNCSYSETVAVISGTGSAEDPYEIATLNGLKSIASRVNGSEGTSAETFSGKIIKLVQDIDLSSVDNWTPIGTGKRSGNGTAEGATPFKGTFDGNNHTISGLKILSADKEACIGLFGILDGGIVKNLIFKDVNISADCENIGTVVGLAVDNSTIENITVESGTLSGEEGTGGIVGRMTIKGTIRNCKNNASVTTSSKNAGGIVGAAYYSKNNEYIVIGNCANNGTVTGSCGTGGIAGLSAANINGCSNTGDIIGKTYSVGGIVGEINDCGFVRNSANSGTVTCSSSSSGVYGVGGIVGWIRYYQDCNNYERKEPVEISGNTNTGTISAEESNGVGGIVGMVYNVAEVNGNTNSAESITGKSFVSHIIGGHQILSPHLIDKVSETEIKNNISSTVDGNVTATEGCKGASVYLNGNAAVTLDTVTKVSGNTPNTNDMIEYTITYDKESIEGATLKTLKDNENKNKYVSSYVPTYGMTTSEQTSGKSVSLPLLEKSGFTFLGWSETSCATKATYEATSDGCTMTIDAGKGRNVTLFAVWENSTN